MVFCLVLKPRLKSDNKYLLLSSKMHILNENDVKDEFPVTNEIFIYDIHLNCQYLKTL